MLLALLPRFVARRAFACFTALLATTAALLAQTPSAADGYDPNVDGNVYVLASQPDGKLIVGGQFGHFRTREGFATGRNNLARLNADGTLDEAFNPNVNGPVRAIVLLPNGQIVIGGDFTSLQPGATGAAVSRSRLARLNADGSVDAGFQVNIGSPFLPQVFALALQPDGALVVGGAFSTVQPGSLTVIFNRRNLFRLTPAGAVDGTFDPNPNGMVLALAPHAAGKLLVGGGFTSFQEAGRSSPTTRNRIARLNADGTLDASFDPNANNGVTSLAVQRDGKILLGGHFTAFQPAGSDSPATRNRLARLNVDGSLDSDFFPNTNGSVYEIAVQPDGAVLVGGTFTSAWGRGSASTQRGNVVRFLPDGSLDASFNPNFNAQVDAFAFPPDGKIVVGGYFTRAQPPGAVTAIVRNRLARLNVDGSIDADFELNAGGRILATALQSDGKLVVGGSFTNLGGETHNYLARLNADGSVDTAYRPDFNGRVFSLAVQPDGKTIVGGAFTSIGGESRNRLARLNPDGTLDTGFNPNLDGAVAAIVLQPDGKILVGGSFTSLLPPGATERVTRNFFLRLNADGSLDTAFNPSPNSDVSFVALQSDGKILLAGLFSALVPNGGTATARNFIARVNADGSLDTAFDPNPNGRLSALLVQPDNKILIGGAFSGFLPNNALTVVERLRLARLNVDGTVDATYNTKVHANIMAMALQPDGRLILGGDFLSLQPSGAADPTFRRYAARLNTDGSIDTGFNLELDEQAGNRVDSLRLLPDGRLLLGGVFTSLQPGATPTRVVRRNFARLNADGTLDTGFEPGVGGAAGGQVHALAIQADNKVVAVGAFSDLGGAKTTNIARFNAEGTPDQAFGNVLSTTGPVHAVVLRPNSTTQAAPVSGFAWLNRNGTLRTTFAPGDNARLSGEIYATAVQPDGSLLLGGAFTNRSEATGGNLVRFRANGTLDASFNPSPNGSVLAIAQQSDGRIVIVGTFTNVHGVTRNRIARLNPDGTLDSSFDPNANARINAVGIAGDGRIVVGGAFTSFTPNGTTNATLRNYLARLNADGTVDTAYNPNVNAPVHALVIQDDGSVVAGGDFISTQPNTATAPMTRNYIARFYHDAMLDQNFNPHANGPVAALALQSNGQILVGGGFTTFQPGATGTIHTRNYIARLNGDGTVDAEFNPNANAAVGSLALQSDGSVLLGGSFTALQPQNSGAPVTRHHLARVGPSGALDLDFNPDVNGQVFGVAARPDGSVFVAGNFSALQPNGSLVVGGNFTSIGGIPARNLAALSDEGSVNSAFQPQPDGAVHALLVQGDGKMLVAGAFSNLAGAARNRLARFNVDGTLDAAFNPNVNGTVYALALQSDGKILVGGAFSSVGTGGAVVANASGLGIVRLNADGTVDASFTAPSPGLATLAVRALAVQADHRILFVSEGSGIRHTLSRLNANGSPDSSFTPVQSSSGTFSSLALQADGRILLGGEFTLGNPGISRLARLNRDGSLDPSFNPGVNGTVTALALQSDGRVVFGGSFSRVGGIGRDGIARVPAGSATQLLGIQPDRRTLVWARGGATGELAAVTFELSTDRSTWTPLGVATRMSGTANWQLANVTLPASGVFHVRARGIAPAHGVSSGLYQAAREFNFTSPLSAPTTVIANSGASAVPGGAITYTFDLFSGVFATTIVGSGSLPSDGSPPAGGSRLADIATQARVSSASPLLAGFTVGGSGTRNVLVRAVGPGLASFGVTGVLSAPQLRLYDGSGQVLATNEGWANSATLSAAFAQAGAFPLPAGSADAAALVSLPPGSYTIQVSDGTGSGGVALAEVYDVGHATQPTGSARLINLSTRAAINTGGNVVIGGFVVTGTDSKRLLVRGVGPSLAQFGVPGVSQDPAVVVYDSSGRALASNDDWSSASVGLAGEGSATSTPAQVAAAATSAGAFALEADSKDAALVITLAPGAYTIHLSDQNRANGAALIELYELP